MIATCANPACNELFRYFRIGKIFMLDANDLGPRSRTDHPKTQNRVFLVVWGMRPGHAPDANDGRGSYYLRIFPVF
jgi:hypothetical protein